MGRDRVVLPRSEVVLALLLGLTTSAVLVALMPDVRRHMFGGTELRTTTVVAAQSRPHPEDDDREVARYRLTWRDDAGATHTSTLERTGPVRRVVGDTWDLWVTPDHPEATDESPWATWSWLGVGIPLLSLALGWLLAWRRRLLTRATVAGPRWPGRTTGAAP